MRKRHVIVVVAVILVAVGARLTFFTAPTADADPLFVESAGVDVYQLHRSAKSPLAQESHDMSLVFPVSPDGD